MDVGESSSGGGKTNVNLHLRRKYFLPAYRFPSVNVALILVFDFSFCFVYMVVIQFSAP